MLKKMLSTLHAPEPAIPRLTTAFPSLHEQAVAAAETSVKIRLSILGTAMVDALGGPAEFKSRFSFELVTSMIPNDNFALGSGVWTDDTSMTLCLARSLATFQSSPSSPKGGFDPKDQLDAYLRWFGEGWLSAVGRCFDIGNTISRALSIYERRIQEDGIEKSLRAIEFSLDGRECSGNGSLMRVLPIGLAYWRHEDKARAFARQSSVTTHPNTLCQEACEVWTGAITRVLQASSPGSDIPQLTKLDILDYFVKFPYQDKALRGALSLAADVGEVPASAEERETFYREHHPILHLIDTQQSKATSANDWIKIIPSQKELPSTGYVLHTLVAALYSFLATKTFEEGAILAVNLGSDADTVGAIYGGLASCWYAGSEEVKTSDLFWSQTVREWQKALVRRNIVEDVAEELVKAQKSFM